MDKELKKTLLINTISDCILINHLGITTDKTLFTAFENLCYLLEQDYYEIDPCLFQELENVIKKIKIEEVNSNTELTDLLLKHSKEVLPELINIIEKYK